MKKYILAVLLCMCFLFVACGKKESVENTEKQQEENMVNEPDKQVSSENEKKEASNAIEGPISVELVRAHKPASEEDFEVIEYESTVKIKKYVGTDEIVVIPDTIKGKVVTEMMDLVFGNESQVRGLLLPETITEISHMTVNNQVIEVIICEGVQIVGWGSFVNCPKLRCVVFGEELVDLGDAPFGMCKELREIYVPSKKVFLEDYKIQNLFYDTPDVTVYGIAGSSMEEYAKQNNVKFVAQ